jgi:uncharacterized protein YjbJ (UPF0337 family)
VLDACGFEFVAHGERITEAYGDLKEAAKDAAEDTHEKQQR